MTNQDLIRQTVLQGKCTLACWGHSAIQQENGGENINCNLKEMYLLNKWNEILETYYCQKYDSVDPDTAFICLTEEEALELVGKVKIFIA